MMLLRKHGMSMWRKPHLFIFAAIIFGRTDLCHRKYGISIIDSMRAVNVWLRPYLAVHILPELPHSCIGPQVTSIILTLPQYFHKRATARSYAPGCPSKHSDRHRDR